MKTKRKGSIFYQIKKENNTNSIIHIGDYFVSDYLMPKKAGIKAILIRK